MKNKLSNSLIGFQNGHIAQHSLCKKCSYSELFWFIFSRILTEYVEIQSISPYSVRMRGNVDRNSSKTDTFQAVGDP